MLTNKRGFTLIEIVISMAIYAVLLVIMGITAVSFSEINNRVNNPSTLHRRAIAMQGFITDLWQDHNGNIIFSENVLFKVNGAGGPSVFFDEETRQLYYDTRIIDAHESITKITITQKSTHVIFTIFDEEENPFITFILLNAGGNDNEV